MKISVMAATLSAAMTIGGAASATSLDFTANNDTHGTLFGSINWAVTSGNGNLTNSTHKNNNGCNAVAGWTFACNAVGNDYDVGFGVSNENSNEIDAGQGFSNEFVQVAFSDSVVINAFAGMLTYDNGEPISADREQVRLRYSNDNGVTWSNIKANPLFGIGNNFDTVGLAYRDGLSITANLIQFRAAGKGTADDGTFNVTAAGLKVSAVPLPAAGWMLIAGMGGLAAMKRRAKKKAA